MNYMTYRLAVYSLKSSALQRQGKRYLRHCSHRSTSSSRTTALTARSLPVILLICWLMKCQYSITLLQETFNESCNNRGGRNNDWC